MDGSVDEVAWQKPNLVLKSAFLLDKGKQRKEGCGKR
jgi:hypothetical protein